MKHLLALILACVCAYAIPQQINYQGQLTSPSGTPLDTTVSITFRMYTGAVGGAQLWTETHPAVNVTLGLFHASLGEISSLTDVIFNQPQVWLGVTVGSNSEMTPRTQVSSSAYSYYTGTVHGATGGTITGDVAIAGKGNIGTGNSNTGVGAFVAGTNGTVIGNYSSVLGGAYGSARGDYSVVCGGGGSLPIDSNCASGSFTTISGGKRQIALGDGSVIGGGSSNSTPDDFAVVGGAPVTQPLDNSA